MDAQPPDGHRAPLRVLVVDDNDITRYHTVQLLRRQGFGVLEARDGNEALELVGNLPVDLVLMDVQLPDMDGLSVTRAIRRGAGARSGNAPDMPILALTGFASDQDREQCLAAGMTDFLTRPVQSPDLVAAITKAMDDGRKLGWPNKPPFDISECAARGREGFVPRLLSLFLEVAQPKAEALQAAVDRLDLAVAGGLAHDLAGMAGPIQALELGDCMKALQQACRAGDETACRRIHDRAAQALRAVLTAVRAHPELAARRS